VKNDVNVASKVPGNKKKRKIIILDARLESHRQK
jgi:hypothetical protein